MKRHNTILVFSLTAAIAAAVLGIAILSSHQMDKDYPTTDPVPSALPLNKVEREGILRFSTQAISTDTFIDRRSFESSWSRAKIVDVSSGVVAGVLNHHVLAADLMAGFFLSLKASAPQTRRFIVISPDHFFSGHGPISTLDRNYSTPDGLLRSDTAFVAELVSSTSAALEDNAMFEREHGVGALAPFIQREFPEAKIVGIALQGTLDRGLACDFGTRLAGLVDSHTVIIVSSDMSHYLPAKIALVNDETTIKELSSLDTQFFMGVKDDHVDNGVGLVVLASYLDALGIKPAFHLVGHGISSDYVSDDKSTTTYINGLWTR